MEDVKDKVIDLTDHIGDFADTFYKLTLLKATEKAAKIASGAIAALVICIIGFFVLFFGGFALSWWLGDLVNSRAGGFLLGAGFFLLVVVIVALCSKKIIFPYLRNLIIRKAYD